MLVGELDGSEYHFDVSTLVFTETEIAKNPGVADKTNVVRKELS